MPASKSSKQPRWGKLREYKSRAPVNGDEFETSESGWHGEARVRAVMASSRAKQDAEDELRRAPEEAEGERKEGAEV
jgi:hypothetical protein